VIIFALAQTNLFGSPAPNFQVLKNPALSSDKAEFSSFQNDCKSRLGRVVAWKNNLTSNLESLSVQSCPNGKTRSETFPKTGRSGQEKCATQCAVKQTQSPATACYVAGIEDYSSRLNVIGPQVRKLRTNKGWK
jgi:hypothetical protein